MTDIGGPNSGPDFSGIEPITNQNDLDELYAAILEFESKQIEFMNEARNANRAVQVAMSWVNAGDKVLAIAHSIVDKRLESGSTSQLDELKQKIKEFDTMRTEMIGALQWLLV